VKYTIPNCFSLDPPEFCTQQLNGFSFVVPDDKALLITDVEGTSWTDGKGMISLPVSRLQTPFVARGGEILCPWADTPGVDYSLFISGRLVDAT
jgi:hypothetical protein